MLFEKGPEKMKKTIAAAAVALFLAVGLTPRAFAWGKTGHIYANSAAVGTLPPETSLGKFFAANQAFLAAHSSDPDVWRDKQRVTGEGPHHFIDLDIYGTPGDFALLNLPVKRADADAKFGHDLVESKGTVDWMIDLWTARLSDAMKGSDPDLILADAAILGHYVADAHVPFHSAVNYDGQLSGQRGIHARFEEEMVHNTIKLTDLAPDPAQPLADVLGSARLWSGQSLDLTPTILQADIQARVQATMGGKAVPDAGPLPTSYNTYTHKPLPKDGSPTADYYQDNPVYWKTFSAITRPIALARLNASASHLGSVWLTAWQRAGSPDLSRLQAPTANVPIPVADPDAK
jgi:hypothetical protein